MSYSAKKIIMNMVTRHHKFIPQLQSLTFEIFFYPKCLYLIHIAFIILYLVFASLFIRYFTLIIVTLQQYSAQREEDTLNFCGILFESHFFFCTHGICIKKKKTFHRVCCNSQGNRIVGVFFIYFFFLIRNLLFF